MDAPRFDRLVASFVTSGSRRALLRLLTTLPLFSPLASLLDEESEAAKRRRHSRAKRRDRVHDVKKKKKKCAKAGQTTNKKRKKCCAGLVKGGNGVCTASCTTANCPANACGTLPDGCGGTIACGCPANQICLRSGVCQACTVTCTGTPAQCGTALQTAMNAGGTVFACPGRYQGNFKLNAAVRVIGAGEGDDPASNTILDANGAGRVLQINSGVGLVELERLGIIGGNLGGIEHRGTKLRLTECTVSGNTGVFGGGISADGTLEMTRCTVRDNHVTGMLSAGAGLAIVSGPSHTTTLTDCLVEANIADGSGGGLYLGSLGATTLAGTQVRGNLAGFGGAFYITDGTLVIAEDCGVTENIAPSGHGGGIYLSNGAVVLLGPDPSPIVVNNCHENCAPIGDVTKCAATPVSC